MRTRAFGALLCAAAMLAGACGIAPGGLFRQYEYEEDVYLSLDGSATIYVNSSVPVFNALRGTSIDPGLTARIDDDVRRYFETPVSRVTRLPRPSRRNNRRYLHVRLDAPDVRQLAKSPAFSWSHYEFRQEGSEYLYRQTVGSPAGAAPGESGLSGDEIVAFRLHLPSRITYHNAGAPPARGNILVWEQSLRDRLSGVPVVLDVRMESQSILYSTLKLFGVTLVAAAVAFGFVIWWLMRKGRRAPRRSQAGQTGRT
jgi:hypothetical protein